MQQRKSRHIKIRIPAGYSYKGIEKDFVGRTIRVNFELNGVVLFDAAGAE